ncbi:c-type cytochrome [Desulfuromonas versatilis]|uniref:C-type cytochrome n=1 Tax=Desulfuromonas versatilis TaxID=2802975 RepID=A0ABM8I270_9BACT|nr:cytochrome c3 family protein [Desulfuromonas versatilis]BCR06935.1 c-type cytochrome [Desulfuromonas versatilis]
MSQKLHRFIPMLLLLLAIAVPAAAENGVAIDPAACIECHEDSISLLEFGQSVHGKNACTSCHVEVTSLEAHADGEIMPGPVKCSRCHKKETAEHYASVHMLNDVKCADCHYDVHTHNYWKGDKNKIIEKCTTCHDDHADYLDSIHGQAVSAGNMDSAACSDCHNLHEIKPLGDAASHENRDFHTKVCLNCHDNQEMMTRNGVFNVAVKTYMESYHGKNYRLGYPELVAGCADCHTSHNVRPHTDPKSSVNPANLVETCAQCHENASPLFTKFYSHGEHSDRDKYPILYWTFICMTGLLVGTFGVFWIHTLLWMFRGFVENREKKLALMHGEHHVIPEAYKIYRRFNRRHVALHFLVIISFLLLSLTGLPLKFADQPWAKLMMDFYGGAHTAALLHRVGAGITFIYFAGAIVLSIHFLFIRKDLPGNWLLRLFGPDSLCPNFRDIRDVTGMVRWFLFRGPKPTFERWTYWEKFDFIAVFWGMFAIGGSGLMLWFPEFFGLFLPGWMFNVATIVHSDEALLATGFIFTVHFFNTHGRPEKFPMDFVIFNGEINKEEFIEERGDQWKRYQELGITEDFVKEKPSGVVYDFFFKTFGFIAVIIGLALVVLMVYGFMHGSH